MDKVKDQEKQLDELLELVEKTADPAHCKKVDERYSLALAGKPVDRVPLFIQAGFSKSLALPQPWDKFTCYSYRETYSSPVAMMQNHILERVAPGIILKDDSPLAIRANHGTVQVASILGGKWEQRENHYPWIEHFDSPEELERIANEKEIDFSRGVFKRSIETMQYYREKLEQRPALKKIIQISIPDLQGPIDTAEQLWGSSIFYSIADGSDLLALLMDRVATVTAAMAEEYWKYAFDRQSPRAHTQHSCVVPGRILVRVDTAIMLSANMYREFVLPHDAKVLRKMGTGSIHFCGNGEHLVKEMLNISELRGLDFGQPQMMNLPGIFEMTRAKNIPIVRLQPSREDLISGKAQREFPTCCTFMYNAESMEDAAEVVNAYRLR